MLVFPPRQKNQYRNAFASAELPRPFTDTTRAVLVDWLIQVHVSALLGVLFFFFITFTPSVTRKDCRKRILYINQSFLGRVAWLQQDILVPKLMATLIMY